MELAWAPRSITALASIIGIRSILASASKFAAFCIPAILKDASPEFASVWQSANRATHNKEEKCSRSLFCYSQPFPTPEAWFHYLLVGHLLIEHKKPVP